MGWHRLGHLFDSLTLGYRTSGLPLTSPAVNEQCFIRKQHKCGKMHGVSKSCFIACPTDDDLETVLELISEKLTKLGIEPIIAVKERAYGQDIFCTKICGRIIESRFCIAILNDSIRDGVSIPNPNVYYEYGVMTALRKHIIPLQKADMNLAFNIQSYDTVKYGPKNIGAELERGIRDAVKITEAKQADSTPAAISERMILRRIELAGFEAKDTNWFLNDAIGDTGFRGFGHREGRFYAYVGKIDAPEDMRSYLDDLSVVVYRTEKKADGLQAQLDDLRQERSRTEQAFLPLDVSKITRAHQSQPVDQKIRDIESRLHLMSTIHAAFLVAPDQDVAEFVKSANSMVAAYGRYVITCSDDGKLHFGDICVDFTTSQH